MNLTLRPMSRERLAEYLDGMVDDYVDQLIASGTEPDAARKNAADTIADSFPDGEPADDNEVYDVTDGDDAVGILWIAERSPQAWWIYDIEMLESKRGRGYGRATMLAAEDRVRELGGISLGLHVFGTNSAARGLYESLGFEPTNIQMRKAL